MISFNVDERGQGEDLNGDGDRRDFVLFVHDVETQVTTNLGLATNLSDNHSNARFCAFGVSETDQGNTDLNGNGFSGNVVLHLYDSLLGQVENIGFDMDDALLGDDILAFVAPELSNGARI